MSSTEGLYGYLKLFGHNEKRMFRVKVVPPSLRTPYPQLTMGVAASCLGVLHKLYRIMRGGITSNSATSPQYNRGFG